MVLWALGESSSKLGAKPSGLIIPKDSSNLSNSASAEFIAVPVWSLSLMALKALIFVTFLSKSALRLSKRLC